MKNININQSILFLSNLLHYIMIFTIAILCGKISWWLIKPTGYNLTENAATSMGKVETVVQGIVNRAPFGIITTEKAAAPTIVDNIKIVGTYAAGPKNSVVFLQINNKDSIAMIGESIQGSQIKLITPNSVIVTKDDKEQTLYLSSDSSSKSNSDVNNYNKQNNNNQAHSSTDNSNNARENPSSTANDDKSNNANEEGNSDGDSIAEKRRKMIEAFQKQNENNDNDH